MLVERKNGLAERLSLLLGTLPEEFGSLFANLPLWYALFGGELPVSEGCRHVRNNGRRGKD